MKNTFYCQNANTAADFNIQEWDKVSEELENTNLSEKEKNDILFPKPCNEQCFDCCAIVGERKIKTKLIMKKKEILNENAKSWWLGLRAD